MTTPAALRAQILAAFAAADPPVVIGTYTFPDGSTTEALSVGDPPPGTRAEGFEVLIRSTTEAQMFSTFGGGFNLRRWPVRVIDWARAGLDAPLNALAAAFGPIPTPAIVPETPDNPEQFTILVLDE